MESLQMRVIRQRMVQDCGFACLAMVAAQLSRPVRPEVLVSLLPPEAWARGLSMEQMCELARHIGISATTVRCSAGALRRLPAPGIAHWRQNHYVAIERQDRRGVTFIDPSYGRGFVTWDQLADQFSGYYMTFRLVDEPSDELIGAERLYDEFLRRSPIAIALRNARSSFLEHIGVVAASYGIAVVCVATAVISALKHHTGSGLMAASIVLLAGLLGLLRRTTIERRLQSACLDSALTIATGCSAEPFWSEPHTGRPPMESLQWLTGLTYDSRQGLMHLMQAVACMGLVFTADVLMSEWSAAMTLVTFATILAIDAVARFRDEHPDDNRHVQRIMKELILKGNVKPTAATRPEMPSPIRRAAFYAYTLLPLIALWASSRIMQQSGSFVELLTPVTIICVSVWWVSAKAYAWCLIVIAGSADELRFRSLMAALKSQSSRTVTHMMNNGYAMS